MTEKVNRFARAAIEMFSKMKEESIAPHQIKKEFSIKAGSTKGCPRSTFYYLVAKGFLKGVDGFEIKPKELESNNFKCIYCFIKHLSKNKKISMTPRKLWDSFELKSTSSRNKGGLASYNNQMDVILALYRENALNI